MAAALPAEKTILLKAAAAVKVGILDQVMGSEEGEDSLGPELRRKGIFLSCSAPRKTKIHKIRPEIQFASRVNYNVFLHGL
jgi:hypothetical protein